jgi:hypothetical protein
MNDADRITCGKCLEQSVVGMIALALVPPGIG